MLDRLQSNILKSHGRRNALLLLLRFRDSVSAGEIRDWMAAFAHRYVTSASRQLEEIELFRATGRDAGTILCNFFLSPTGYRRLGLEPSGLDPELSPVSFARGMAKAGLVLNDPPQGAWEECYKVPIDATILLAADDGGVLLQEIVAFLPELLAVAEPPVTEVGRHLLNEEGQRIEHFGFVDGIGNPRFATADPGGESFTQWDSRAETDLVLAQDLFAPEPDCWGSFLVYRKLEQNVKRFRELVGSLSLQLQSDPPESREKLAEAMVVGRFRNGSPLTLSPTDNQSDTNDFDYREDRAGRRCPLHAHIRKMNPRGGSASPSLESLEKERAHRIARRGITYGRRAPKLDDAPETGVGTLFLCFQRSIPRQFAFLQKSWANRPGFPRAATGLDPLAGRAPAHVVPIAQQWPSNWDTAADQRIPFDFRDVVTLKGGEFFFAPSLPFLLAGRDQPPAQP